MSARSTPGSRSPRPSYFDLDSKDDDEKALLYDISTSSSSSILSELRAPSRLRMSRATWWWNVGLASLIIVVTLLWSKTTDILGALPSLSAARVRAGHLLAADSLQSKPRGAFVLLADPDEDLAQSLIPTLRNVEEHYGYTNYPYFIFIDAVLPEEDFIAAASEAVCRSACVKS